MQISVKHATILALLLAAPALVLAAAPDKAEKVAERMLDFGKALQEAGGQVDKTLASMNALAEPGGDLSAKYKIFNKDVNDLDKMAVKAKSNAQSAAAKRDDYLAEVKASQEKIQNPQLKAAADARRAELEPKIEAIKTSLTVARDSFTPFMQALKDLTVFLGTQLNAGGIASASELMGKCTQDGVKVKEELERGAAAVNDLAGSIQPGGPAKG